MKTQRILSMATVVLLTLNLVAPAMAQPNKAIAAAEGKALEAKSLHKDGKYEEAAARFAEAYGLSNKPDMLFNAARMYQMGGKYDKAQALFKQYLKVSKDEEGKAQAEAHLMAIETALVEQKKAEKPMPAGPAPESVTPKPRIDTPAGPETTVSVERPAPDTNRWITWTSLGAGAALGIASGIQLWRAEGIISDAKNMNLAPDGSEKTFTAKGEEASDLRTTSMLLGGVGVALVGYGAYRFFTEPTATESDLVVAPMAGKNGNNTVVGLAVGGTFGGKK